MDCAGIQELLSEYIDGTLDAKAVQVVEKHFLACENCKETLVSLSAMVEELNALEPVKAPADFLEKIHQRMEQRSDLNRLFRKLFVPFKIKIPLQLAAAATASILVVMVLSLQKSEYQKTQPLKASKSEWFVDKSKADHLTPEFKTKTKRPAPVLEEVPGRLSDSEQRMPFQRSREKTLVQPSIQRESEPSSSFLAKARPSARKGQPIELDLLLKPVVIGGAYAPYIAMQTTPLPEGDKKTIEKERTDKDFLEGKIEAGQKYQVDDLLLSLNHIIWPLKGKILTKEYHKQKDQLK
ncbi:MAG: zf-HC2 domain-containing protein, partial [Proteobacteria bacterium]|nr:zf-HC2 domain-containing protein [Pseudomonadota bacterium]